MAWNVPSTWVDEEVVSANDFNEQIRDNQIVLKTSRTDLGKIVGLTSDYVEDLDASALTGLAKTDSTGGSTYTAGVQHFNGGSTTRVVVPVGANLYSGTTGNKTAGSVWVEGDYLHYVDQGQDEWRFAGVTVSTPGGGAIEGSLWVEANRIHYLDASGVERRVDGSAGHSDTAAQSGSLWVEGDLLHWINNSTREYEGHVDSHSDSAHTDDAHSDVSHVDSTPHTDTPHTDSPAVNLHTDIPHTDFRFPNPLEGPGHADVPPTSAHTDTPHGDSHGDTTSHSDTPHSDDAHGDGGHSDSHTDKPELIGA